MDLIQQTALREAVLLAAVKRQFYLRIYFRLLAACWTQGKSAAKTSGWFIFRRFQLAKADRTTIGLQIRQNLSSPSSRIFASILQVRQVAGPFKPGRVPRQARPGHFFALFRRRPLVLPRRLGLTGRRLCRLGLHVCFAFAAPECRGWLRHRQTLQVILVIVKTACACMCSRAAPL
jgi:hypothetical protein